MLAWTLLHQFSVFLRATVASSEKRLVNAEHGDQLEQVEGSGADVCEMSGSSDDAAKHRSRRSGHDYQPGTLRGGKS